MAERDPRVLAIDAGGTMTDTFIVDGAGSFVVGKAQTTPEDESIGFIESARDALEQWDSSPEESFPRIASGIYSGTAMLNRLLSRTGRNVGAIVTAGTRTTCGSNAGSRPTSGSRMPTASISRPTTTTSRSCPASR